VGGPQGCSGRLEGWLAGPIPSPQHPTTTTGPHLLEQAKQHVGVDGALVGLVQDDDTGGGGVRGAARATRGLGRPAGQTLRGTEQPGPSPHLYCVSASSSRHSRSSIPSVMYLMTVAGDVQSSKRME
jgi:hypothetical protein